MDNAESQSLNPLKLFDSRQFGFSQIVQTGPGKMVFISGQVAWDEQMQIIGPRDLALQSQKAIDNLKVAMHTVGGTLDNIVMLRIYKVKYQPEDGPIISKVLIDNFGTESPPASTWVSVDGLANADFLIEIEAQAVV